MRVVWPQMQPQIHLYLRISKWRATDQSDDNIIAASLHSSQALEICKLHIYYSPDLDLLRSPKGSFYV